MRKLRFIAILFVVVLAACGGEEGKENNAPSQEEGKGQETEQEGTEETFHEVETIQLETPFVHTNFSLDESGEILMWNEQGSQEESTHASKVWNNGDIQDLEIDKYGNTVLLPSGMIVTAHVDLEAAEDEKHLMIEYDPVTGNEETFRVEADLNVRMLHPDFGTYLEDSKTYVHTVVDPEEGGEDSFLLDVESNDITDVTIVQDIIQEAGGGELTSFPQFFLTDDASKIYASVVSLGAFVYDVDKKELDTLVLDDDFVGGLGDSTMLTADGSYFTYMINDSTDSELNTYYHAVDVETKETFEIGKGTKLFTLTDGNVVIIDGEDVNKFDMETMELTTIYTVPAEENQEIEDITVSLDGNTIAYSYREKDEDEKKDFIKVLNKQ